MRHTNRLFLIYTIIAGVSGLDVQQTSVRAHSSLRVRDDTQPQTSSASLPKTVGLTGATNAELPSGASDSLIGRLGKVFGSHSLQRSRVPSSTFLGIVSLGVVCAVAFYLIGGWGGREDHQQSYAVSQANASMDSEEDPERQVLRLLFKWRLVSRSEADNASISQEYFDECSWIAKTMLEEKPLDEWHRLSMCGRKSFEDAVSATFAEEPPSQVLYSPLPTIAEKGGRRDANTFPRAADTGSTMASGGFPQPSPVPQVKCSNTPKGFTQTPVFTVVNEKDDLADSVASSGSTVSTNDDNPPEAFFPGVFSSPAESVATPSISAVTSSSSSRSLWSPATSYATPTSPNAPIILGTRQPSAPLASSVPVRVNPPSPTASIVPSTEPFAALRAAALSPESASRLPALNSTKIGSARVLQTVPSSAPAPALRTVTMAMPASRVASAHSAPQLSSYMVPHQTR